MKRLYLPLICRAPDDGGGSTDPGTAQGGAADPGTERVASPAPVAPGPSTTTEARSAAAAAFRATATVLDSLAGGLPVDDERALERRAAARLNRDAASAIERLPE